MSDASIFGNTLGFGRRAALLVVDLTRAFTEVGRPLASDCTQVIENTNRIIDAAHENGQSVIFTTVHYDAPDFSDGGLWGRKIAGQDDLRTGGNGSEIDPRLHRKPEDAVLVKKYASCFFGTDLGSRLTSQGIDTLAITGVSTSGCIRATAVDAIQYGFRPIVAAEAVGDRWDDAHRQSLSDIQAKYGDVLTVDRVIEGLAAIA